jgi:hypothetical protein
LNTAKKLELLCAQRDAAEAAVTGRAELEMWRTKTATVLRLTMGESHEHTYAFDNISYVSRVTSNPNLDRTMRQKGVDRAVALLNAAIFEVGVTDGDQEQIAAAYFDEELSEEIDHLVEIEKWDQVVSQSVIFFEHWVRTRAALPNSVTGAELMKEAFRPGGHLGAWVSTRQ